MAVFTFHVPPDSGDRLADAERVVVLPDRFSWGAMLFGPLWFLARNAWLGLFIWLVLAAALAGLVVLLHPTAGLVVAAAFALAIYFGCEGREYVRMGLERRGFREADIVGAPNAREAERAFFLRWLGDAGRSSSLPSARPPARNTGGGGVIGMFPEPEGLR